MKLGARDRAQLVVAAYDTRPGPPRNWLDPAYLGLAPPGRVQIGT